MRAPASVNEHDPSDPARSMKTRPLKARNINPLEGECVTNTNNECLTNELVHGHLAHGATVRNRVRRGINMRSRVRAESYPRNSDPCCSRVSARSTATSGSPGYTCIPDSIG